jgi:hypothetical protein
MIIDKIKVAHPFSQNKLQKLVSLPRRDLALTEKARELNN